ncbi:PTS lactose/cellobiose transporter subunit IIA [Brachybacterium endophyticum]|uniref:PTS lactose/cellobiose transporter subunit IIA n=1 Tax=Brachybacterium endophyticum TaxID=2182385 RepID=A0A2U2RNI2_9MICO|nr:PTS lactose/cellobiose transporter subunit IIA [Brachybacterium endophyticum]PWH07428.1 PTS lactose/cellobiose transporter subunit IIA [Brachybacterium endophyticum]
MTTPPAPNDPTPRTDAPDGADPLVQDSMTILIEAGKGRSTVYRSLRALEGGDFAGAKEHLRQAHDELEAAHQVHTDRIQAEAGGEESGYSMLFAHAQDTMMTAYSEYRIITRILPVLSSFDDRLTALEETR